MYSMSLSCRLVNVAMSCLRLMLSATVVMPGGGTVSVWLCLVFAL